MASKMHHNAQDILFQGIKFNNFMGGVQPLPRPPVGRDRPTPRTSLRHLSTPRRQCLDPRHWPPPAEKS